MRRKRAHHEAHNKERWLVSYADFITLLFAFFVVMYSISSVNEGKYKVLSETLEGAFNSVQRTVKPIQMGENRPREKAGEQTENLIRPIETITRGSDGRIADRNKGLREMADQFTSQFAGLISEGLVTVNENENWIEVSLTNSVLFKSGDVEPFDEAFPIIERMAHILKQHDNAVLVEGFTDNIPIRTSRFPSNWELSSARSAAMVRMLAFEGVDPGRLAAIGYGEFQPVSTNDTLEGRRKNRRVVLLVSKESQVRVALRK
ncbi:MAG: flagellar motor protein MotD [Hahellaceae bacterium]|nr:flagellar motor protein MotD [Hahellaceae bacterium]